MFVGLAVGRLGMEADVWRGVECLGETGMLLGKEIRCGR